MAQEKVKVKSGMGGTGGGRWCTREIAKKSCNIKRRREDKKAAREVN